MEYMTTHSEDFLIVNTTEISSDNLDETTTSIKPIFDHSIRESVTSPKWEKTILLIYGCFLLIVGTSANSLVLYLTARHQKFHEAYMYIRAAYAVVDIILVWGTVPIVTITLFFDGLVPTSGVYL